MIWIQVGVAIAVVLVAVLWLRLHALLALLGAGLLVAAMTPQYDLQQFAQQQIEAEKWTPRAAEAFVASGPASRLASAFGSTAGNVGILIAMASIIGVCLLESGAAQTIIDRALAVVGPRRAPEALMCSSFLLGIPVFFDTVFYLMVPLARTLRRKLGGDYVLFILAILAGGSLAHSLIPPTPGPLQVADTLQIDVATLMLTGLAVCACSSVVSLAIARLINRLVTVPLRPLVETDGNAGQAENGDSAEDSPRPPLLWSLLPIVLPVLLIGIGTAYRMLVGKHPLVEFISDKNVALGISAVAALLLLSAMSRSDPDSRAKRNRAVQRALAGGGTIILITAAGGAFGAMLRQAGIATVIGQLVQGGSGVSVLVIAFLVTAAIRTIQGSATVAMITAAGLLQDLAAGDTLPFHPVYLALAIGAGSKPISWMTDSGFWVICKMSGMTEGEGLRTVTPMMTAMGVVALFFTILGATLFPM
ncbi:GntP family permease [Roseimaritima ulvae]|uniref:Inner membrane permease YgbN n=1 Tax=Roseimaritima ulvae TaxID=980254 RepID=A0A5B9QLH4_9BACT|nr:SLC13 family permease [Roseimaritima ulvae]QEG38869.1 Inner membrane permease YgbN [Roseimaritima ulvae]